MKIVKKYKWIIILAVVILGGVFFTGEELTKPGQQVVNSWQQQKIDEIGLTFKIPENARFRKEVGKDEVVRKLVFYVEKGSDDNPDYLLYGLYQFKPDRPTTYEVDIERWKAEMDTNTIKNTAIGRYVGIEGFVQGKESPYVSERTRYVKVVLKDGGLFSVSTLPPTQEAKALTESILATFNFH